MWTSSIINDHFINTQTKLRQTISERSNLRKNTSYEQYTFPFQHQIHGNLEEKNLK